ncbi:hypothetical protein AAMO2058_000262300 [Amorphochlora amoebiformis]
MGQVTLNKSPVTLHPPESRDSNRSTIVPGLSALVLDVTRMGTGFSTIVDICQARPVEAAVGVAVGLGGVFMALKLKFFAGERSVSGEKGGTEDPEDDEDESGGEGMDMDAMSGAIGIESEDLYLHKVFLHASEFIRSSPSPTPSTASLLALYGLYKQSMEGKQTKSKPGLLDQQGRAKWDAWEANRGLDRNEAKERYIALVTKLYPSWKTQDIGSSTEGKSNVRPTGFGPTQSSLAAGVKVVKEEDKSILHYVSEGNEGKVKALLEAKIDVNFQLKETTEEGQVLGQTGLHLASDIGNESMAKLLLDSKADVNLQDSEGMSALHFAKLCDQPQVAKLLLAFKADLELKNNDGETPTDCQ